ncbi:MAG: long-chain-fatty-acid--CoA ligase [Candidatus Hodarchaeales archaeon]|jgi:long-chain acyl-CoA synthetase
MDPIWLDHYPNEVPKSIDYPVIPVTDLWDKACSQFPDRPMISFEGFRLTFRELMIKAESFATSLHDLGIRRGDRVAILMPNLPSYVIAFLGIIKAGAIVTQINPLYVAREIEYTLNNAEPQAIVTASLRALPCYEQLKRALPNAPSVEHVIVTSVGDGLPPLKRLLYNLFMGGLREKRAIDKGHLRFTQLVNIEPAPPRFPVNPRDDTLLIQYTGGTTGVSKGAELTHANIVANIFQGRAILTPRIKDGEETALLALPLFHQFGAFVCILAFQAAATIVALPNPRDISHLLKTIQKEKITMFAGVPALYNAIINHPKVINHDLTSIKVCISGAAPLPPEIPRRFEKLTQGRLIEGYGMTETSPLTHINPVFGREKIGSVGLPVPNTEVRIVDPEGQDLGIDEPGEILIRGPQVMKGYWRMPEETAQTLIDGWMHTGDIGKMDEEGYFWIVDRKKDMLISSGFNVYPREIEDILYEMPAILEAAVVGVPDPKRGESAKAFVVLKEGQSVTEEELEAFCRKNLAKYKIPAYYEIRETLPKSAIGKILRRTLAAEEREKQQK